MKREVDALGLVINQAILIAFEDRDLDSLKKLTKLQATYYTLLNEGLQPTPFERLSRPLRAGLGLEDIDTSKLPEVVYKTPIRDIPEIADEELSLTVKRINRGFGGKLLDQSHLGDLPKDIPFWNELPSFHKNIVQRTINVLQRNNVVYAGGVRNRSLEDLMGLRNMGELQARVALNLFAPIEEDSNT